MSQLIDGYAEAESTVGGRLPSVLIGAARGTGGGSSGLGIVRGIQLGQSYRSGNGATGACTCKDTGCGGGGIGGCLVIYIIMAQSGCVHIDRPCAVGSHLPRILIRATFGAGRSPYHSLGVVRCVEFRHLYHYRIGAMRASSL